MAESWLLLSDERGLARMVNGGESDRRDANYPAFVFGGEDPTRVE